MLTKHNSKGQPMQVELTENKQDKYYWNIVK